LEEGVRLSLAQEESAWRQARYKAETRGDWNEVDHAEAEIGRINKRMTESLQKNWDE
jgi:hypothetical protein